MRPLTRKVLTSRYLACHTINMQRNCRRNSSRSGSTATPPSNPATVVSAFANLLSKGRMKYGVTESVRVRTNIRLFALHFIHRYSVDSATGGYRMRTMNSCFCCLFNDKYHYALLYPMCITLRWWTLNNIAGYILHLRFAGQTEIYCSPSLVKTEPSVQ